MMSPRKLSLPVLLTGLALVISANAAVITGTNIDSATITSGILQSITVGSTTYSTLTSPTSIKDNKTLSQLDVIHIGSSAPTSLASAIGSNDITVGALNAGFEAQFTGLTDTTLFYLLVNNNDVSPNAGATVYALDSAGNRIAAAAAALSFNAFADVPSLVGTTTYNRTTGGTQVADIARIVSGVTFTLSDLGLAGLGATGIEFVADGTDDLDPQAFGIVAIPEPTAALLGSLGMVLLLRRRRVG